MGEPAEWPRVKREISHPSDPQEEPGLVVGSSRPREEMYMGTCPVSWGELRS